MIIEAASSWVIELEHFIRTRIGVVNRCTLSCAYELDDGYYVQKHAAIGRLP